MIMRTAIKWCDKKMDEAYNEEEMPKACTKAFVSGAVEGLLDGAIVVGLLYTVCGWASVIKESIKK